MLNIAKSMLKNKKIKKLPKPLKRLVVESMRKIIHEDEINRFMGQNSEKEGVDFIDSVLEHFNISYSVSNTQKANIPAMGRVIIIANHPLGALDALALIKMVNEVRSDIKILANEILNKIENISDLLLYVDNNTNKTTKEAIKQIYNALEEEKAVIIFPAGEVSRIRPTGVKDIHWTKGFLNFSKKTRSPILPVYIDARNSKLFYTTSTFNKPLSGLLLANEMFKKYNYEIKFRIGGLVPFENIDFNLPNEELVKKFKKHLYLIAKGKKGFFEPEETIIHPLSQKEIKQELKNALLLGTTSDGKKIYLYETKHYSKVLKELGRLREFTFRKAGEGTGSSKDIDRYDYYYKHIILWDDEDLEIVGAYRIADGESTLNTKGIEGFYTHSLFHFNDNFKTLLSNSIELGRSFVQPKYWGSRALDYLWQGIGAYLHKFPKKYLFGPVSLSDNYSADAKSLIVYFYKKYFFKEGLVTSPTPFIISQEKEEELSQLFSGDYKEDLKFLKKYLGIQGFAIPTLYKQYTELCDEGGAKFLDFGIDKDFNDCVDGFILVDVTTMKENKRKRYIT